MAPRRTQGHTRGETLRALAGAPPRARQPTRNRRCRYRARRQLQGAGAALQRSPCGSSCNACLRCAGGVQVRVSVSVASVLNDNCYVDDADMLVSFM